MEKSKQQQFSHSWQYSKKIMCCFCGVFAISTKAEIKGKKTVVSKFTLSLLGVLQTSIAKLRNYYVSIWLRNYWSRTRTVPYIVSNNTTTCYTTTRIVIHQHCMIQYHMVKVPTSTVAWYPSFESYLPRNCLQEDTGLAINFTSFPCRHILKHYC